MFKSGDLLEFQDSQRLIMSVVNNISHRPKVSGTFYLKNNDTVSILRSTQTTMGAIPYHKIYFLFDNKILYREAFTSDFIFYFKKVNLDV